jgi:hypothetical protein
MFPTAESPELETPDEQEAQQPTYGQDNRDLPEQLVEAIKAAVLEFQQQDKYARRREVRKDRRNRFYEMSHQHLQWNNSGNAGFSQLSPGAIAYNSSGASIQCPQYMDAYNILFPYFRVIQSVLTQTIPGVDFQPIDPSNPDDIDKAKAAEDYSILYDRMNDLPEIMAQVVRMFGYSGRMVAWTRTEADAQRFGYEADGVTPKRFQRTTIYGTMESKVPITCKEKDQNFLYCFLYDDPDVKKAKSDFPWIAKEIKAGNPGLGENQYERTARLGVLNGARGSSQTGDTLTHIVTLMNAFLRPAAFTGSIYDNPCDDDPSCTVGEKLLQLFPDGCHAVFVGETFAQAFNESLDDPIEVQFPYQGDGQLRKAFMDDMIVVQDNFNDLCNWIREKVDTGAGSLWVRGDQDAVDAVTNQRAAPNAIRPAKDFTEGAVAMPLEHSFYKEPDPSIPETLFKLLEMLRGELPEFLLAALPSLQGGSMADNKTASGYAQANAQAKGQLSIIWGRMQRTLARIRYQSALAASKEENLESVNIPGGKDGQQICINMANLKKGAFGCYPDQDSSFPETTQQQRATIDGLIEAAAANPMIAQLLDNPDNVAEIQRVKGLSELTFLPGLARDKQLHEIERLLKEPPIPASPEELQAAGQQYQMAVVASQATGQPAPPPPNPQSMMKSSVPIDELDYHQWEFQKCQEWLSSPQRRQEDEKGNQAGVMNVRLHALEHQKMMAAMMAAAQPAPTPMPAKKSPAHPQQEKPAPAAGMEQAA